MIGDGLGTCVVAFLQRPPLVEDRSHHSDHGDPEEEQNPR